MMHPSSIVDCVEFERIWQVASLEASMARMFQPGWFTYWATCDSFASRMKEMIMMSFGCARLNYTADGWLNETRDFDSLANGTIVCVPWCYVSDLCITTSRTHCRPCIPYANWIWVVRPFSPCIYCHTTCASRAWFIIPFWGNVQS